MFQSLRFLCYLILMLPLLVIASPVEQEESVPFTPEHIAMQDMKVLLSDHLKEWNEMKPALKRLIKSEKDITLITATLEKMAPLASQPNEKQLLEPKAFILPSTIQPIVAKQKKHPNSNHKNDAVTVQKLQSNVHYGIHLASYKKSKSIEPGWQLLLNALPEQLKDKTPYYYQVVINNNTYTRLLAGPFSSRKVAQQACKLIVDKNKYCQLISYKTLPTVNERDL